MPAIVAFMIVAIAVIAITYKTYVGYGKHFWYTKLFVFLFLILAWCAPFIVFLLKNQLPSFTSAYVIKGLYFIFGFAFFLFVITFVRDAIWMIVDLIKKTPMKDIKNPPCLGKVNVYTIIITFLICIYGVFEAEKLPQVKTYDIVSPKIKENTKVVMLSDLHIDTHVSSKDVRDIVNQVNELKPDAIVLVGDIVDNSPNALNEQMIELKKLSSKYGVYVALGNHEFYVGLMDWILGFGHMGFEIMANLGMKIGDTGLYIAGLPDINAAQNSKMKISVESALYGANKSDFVMMLSHTPKVAEGITKDNTDIILSGHTHGGQIFPFHYFTKKANEGKLAGFYNVNGVKMYISRGARYWGPPMRIGSPSEITVFNLIAEKK